MGVKDLKNYEREQAYLRKDQRVFIIDVAEKARAASGKKINKNDVMRFALDLIMNRKPEHDQEIRNALGIIQAGLIIPEKKAAAAEKNNGPFVIGQEVFIYSDGWKKVKIVDVAEKSKLVEVENGSIYAEKTLLDLQKKYAERNK